MAKEIDSYTLSPVQAKKSILKSIREGKTVDEAMRLVGKSKKTYEYYRNSDPEFRAAVE